MNKIGLYLHYPFCKKKCAYCDFYSLPRLELARSYEQALARHLHAWQEELTDCAADTVYFGGGTPSLCSPEGLKQILSAVRDCVRVESDAEITLEMNPESAGESILYAAREAGVNRISFGVQSTDPRELQMLGRLHCGEEALLAIQRAKKIGFPHVSADLMYGLPYQRKEDFLHSMDTVLQTGIDHLSFYLLTLSPETPLYEKRDALPQEEECRDMYLSAVERLPQYGFRLYEISNASRVGCESRHNQKYWDGAEYLGIGPGAHSLFRNERFRMKEGIEAFILASNLRDRMTEVEKRSEEDRFTERVMLSLRTARGLSRQELLHLSSKECVARWDKKFALWTKHGLAGLSSQGYALTPKGFFVSNEIITELLLIPRI